MIDVTLWTADGHTAGFRISGHAGYEDSGKDIVCAAVTSAMQLTANGKCQDPRVFALLDSLRLQLEVLEEQFPQFIQIHILEV